jgi:N-acetylglucosamine-6-phosphate deacetylase
VEPLREALAVLRQARAAHRPGRCRLLGAHLEGPFLAPARRGAHPLQHLCPPSPAALRERIGGFFGPDAGAPTAGWSEQAAGSRHDHSPGGAAPDWPAGAAAADIARVTLAPELEGASAVIEALRRQGVVVSCLVLDPAGAASARKVFGARRVGVLQTLADVPEQVRRLGI